MPTKTRNFKMEWAKIHLDSLNAELSGAIGKPEEFYRVGTYEDAKRGALTIEAESIGALHVMRIALIAGDFICNLRASLDHLIWDLAAIGNSNRSSEICFPVCVRDSTKTQSKIDAALLGVPPEAIPRVKALQPYNCGKAFKSHPLWRLNFLWNTDKHRSTALHSLQSDVIFHVDSGVPVVERKFNDTTIVTLPLAAKHKVHFNPRPSVCISFGDAERGIKLTIQDLREIYEFVSTDVMPSLSGFLP
jgi:hypothetical protein